MLVTRLNDVPNTELDWLIKDLWSGVGIIGGAPKTRKTFIALDIACAVASGKPICYSGREFIVPRPGPVLYLAGEDKADDLKRRITGPAPNDLYISTDTPQLDTQMGKLGVLSAISSLKPRLLVVDPLVRFHSLSENHVTPVLNFLRSIKIPVVLVHHMTKGKSGGQGLRGSGDLHAWVDTGIYTLSASAIQTEFRHAPGEIIHTMVKTQTKRTSFLEMLKRKQ